MIEVICRQFHCDCSGVCLLHACDHVCFVGHGCVGVLFACSSSSLVFADYWGMNGLGLNSKTSSTTPMDTLLLHWISRNCWQRRAKKIKWILWMWLISPFFYLKMILCVELESFLFPLCTWAIFYQFYYSLVFIFLNNPLFRKVYELKSVLLQSNHESIIKKGWNEWMKKNHDSSKIISEFVKIITNFITSMSYVL